MSEPSPQHDELHAPLPKAKALASHVIHDEGDPDSLTIRIIFQVGVWVTLALVVLTGVTAIVINAPLWLFYRRTIYMVLVHFVGSIMANAGFGSHMDMPGWFIITQSCLVDVASVCFTYTLFARGFEKVAHWPIIGAKLKSAHESALAHSHTVRPYGVVGVIFLASFPIWAHPIAATIVGYLLGIGAFTTVMAASLAAIGCAFFSVYFYEWLSGWNSSAATALLAGVLGITVLLTLVGLARGFRAKPSAPGASKPGPPLKE